MTVYLLKDDRREFASHDVYDAWDGFQELGEETVAFTEAMLKNGVMHNQKSDVVVGWVRTILFALDQMEIQKPDPIDYPVALRKYLGRNVRQDILGNLSNYGKEVYVKPADQVKLFDAFKWDRNESVVAKYGKNTKVWISEVIEIRSEWRLYISNRRIIGAYPYKGDWKLSPKWNDVDAMVEEWDDAPAGCAMDVGIDGAGNTVLIECNDGWALGNYGLLPMDYARLLKSRWIELVSENSLTNR